jgi:RecA-family ATPase
MAAGKALLGIETKQRRVWYVNLEDPREEIERRIAAICLHFNIKPEELGDRLLVGERLAQSRQRTGREAGDANLH